MTRKWPSFVTKDLGDTEADEVEMMRRWQVYDREMRAIIAAGDVHQDADGWWVETATGELIGPDPELERPASGEELAQARPLDEVLPDLAESIRRGRGRPALAHPKKLVTLRLDADLYAKLRESGPGWQSRVNETLRKAVGL
jgi:uncharacterized protein (DUF4415 family)